jgi:hypothetical protein
VPELENSQKTPCLTKGQQIQGTWSASLAVPAAGPQIQAMAGIQFQIPVKTAQSHKLKLRYKNETQVLNPTEFPECSGNAQEPNAEEGWFCIYQGATAEFGSLSTEWKEASFFAVENAAGETCLPAVAKTAGLLTCKSEEQFQLGGFVVFRTNTFKNDGTPVTIPNAAALTAAGSWAVRAKE